MSSGRPDLNEEAYFKMLMGRGDTIMYDIVPELQELMGMRSPADRAHIQKYFVDFCVEHDIVDLHCHQYNVSRNPRLRALLGIDVMQSYDIWRYLRGLIKPFSVQERAL